MPSHKILGIRKLALRPDARPRPGNRSHRARKNEKPMRSSKSRSRNKSNRQRSMGNIINRVFDSSGPEGKVRGTPQQIIDKYLMLARDAQLGNDRVAEQNFLQHAEHYTRMLGEAQAELLREQAERQPQQGGNGGQGGQGSQSGQGGQGGSASERLTPREPSRQDTRAPGEDEPQPDLPAFLTGASRDEGSNLVDTPEAAQGSEPSDRRTRRDDDRPGRDRQFERQGDRHGGERRDRNERRPRPDRDERKERAGNAPASSEGGSPDRVPVEPAASAEGAPRPRLQPQNQTLPQSPAPASDLVQQPGTDAHAAPGKEGPATTGPLPEAEAKPARAPRKPRAPKATKPAAEDPGDA